MAQGSPKQQAKPKTQQTQGLQSTPQRSENTPKTQPETANAETGHSKQQSSLSEETQQEPLARQEATPPAQPQQTPSRRAHHQKPIADPTSEYAKFESYQSERIRYQDPAPERAQDQPRDASPSQRERDISIKRIEAKRICEQEDRIATLSKMVDKLSRENAELKFQAAKLR